MHGLNESGILYISLIHSFIHSILLNSKDKINKSQKTTSFYLAKNY